MNMGLVLSSSICNIIFIQLNKYKKPNLLHSVEQIEKLEEKRESKIDKYYF